MANSEETQMRGSSQDLATQSNQFQVKISIETSTELSTFANLQATLASEYEKQEHEPISNDFSIVSFVCEKVTSCNSARLDELHSSEQQSSNITSSKAAAEYMRVNVDFYNAVPGDSNLDNFITVLKHAISAVKPKPVSDMETEWIVCLNVMYNQSKLDLHQGSNNIAFYTEDKESISFQQPKIVKFVRGLPIPRLLTEKIVNRFQRGVYVD